MSSMAIPMGAGGFQQSPKPRTSNIFGEGSPEQFEERKGGDIMTAGEFGR